MECLEKKVKKLLHNQKPILNPSGGTIYILKASDADDIENIILSNDEDDILLKVGSSEELRQRLLTYNSDKADNITPLYYLETDNVQLVEECIHIYAKQYQYRKKKEIYLMNLDMLKLFVEKCAQFTKDMVKISEKIPPSTPNTQYMVILQKSSGFDKKNFRDGLW
jgi:hypothetical protein